MQILYFFLLILFSVPFAQKEYKPNFLPVYDPNMNLVQEEVEDWIAKEKANVSKKNAFVVLKTDLLGRHLSSGTVEMLKKSRKVSPSRQKRLVVVSDMRISDEPIDEVSGRYEYDATTKLRKYYLNGQDVSEQDYLNHSKNHWKSIYK